MKYFFKILEKLYFLVAGSGSWVINKWLNIVIAITRFQRNEDSYEDGYGRIVTYITTHVVNGANAS